MKKPDCISVQLKRKPRLEDFVRVEDFGLDSEDLKKLKSDQSPLHYYNPKLQLLLYTNPDTFDNLTLLGKPKSVLKYLKVNYPNAHLRLYNYLEYGIDTDFTRKILERPGSSAYVKAFESLTGIKLRPKEEK